MSERIKATCACGATLDVESWSSTVVKSRFAEWQEQHKGHEESSRIKAAEWLDQRRLLRGF